MVLPSRVCREFDRSFAIDGMPSRELAKRVSLGTFVHDKRAREPRTSIVLMLTKSFVEAATACLFLDFECGVAIHR